MPPSYIVDVLISVSTGAYTQSWSKKKTCMSLVDLIYMRTRKRQDLLVH